MDFRTAGVALWLAASAAGAFAQTTSTFTKTFSYLDPVDDTTVLPLGFGRAGDSVLTNRVAPGIDAFSRAAAPEAFTPGVLPFTFHDFWKFNGLHAGVYTFDTTITATGNTGFGVVLFEWFSAGSPSSINFTVSPDYRTAHGTGTFTVDAGCEVQYCVFMHLYGWQDNGADRGYKGLTEVTLVPEPATTALWLAGLGALGLVARRRRAG